LIQSHKELQKLEADYKAKLSPEGAKVPVYIVPADEERIVARAAAQVVSK